jgi:hypothetical protein
LPANVAFLSDGGKGCRSTSGEKMNKIQLLTLAAFSAALVYPVQAQQSPGNALGDFTMERVLTLSGITSTAPPNLPMVILNALASGAIEVHQVFTYNSAQRTLEQTSYVLPGRSAVPNPNLGSAPVNDHYIIQIDSVQLGQAHGQAAALIGHVISNDIPTPFGDIAGTEVTLSFGYQGSGPAMQFSSIAETVTPVYAIYTVAGVGSLSANASAPKCSVATLNGVYTYTLRGSIQTAPGAFAPYVESGHFTADGNGTVAVFGTANVGGAMSPNRLQINYTVNDDCTASFKWSRGSMDVQVSNNGQRLNLVFTSPSAVIAMGDGQLQ